MEPVVRGPPFCVDHSIGPRTFLWSFMELLRLSKENVRQHSDADI